MTVARSAFVLSSSAFDESQPAIATAATSTPEKLRIDEARRWVGKARSWRGGASRGRSLLDDGGKLLWIPNAKTEAGKRTLQVPEVLQPNLKALAKGKGPEEHLFGQHWRDWVRKWVKRICREARVPQVTAHGMRGLHSTLALEHGASAHVVASSLGHESF